jgi:hypothetical protein
MPFRIILGSSLLIGPHVILGLFGGPPTSEIWIRIVGMLLVFLGIFHGQAAHGEVLAYFWWAVYLRLSVIGFFAVFVVLRKAPASLLLFGSIDVLGALWTMRALRLMHTRTKRTEVLCYVGVIFAACSCYPPR